MLHRVSLARLPLDCLRREYPHKLDHVASSDADVRTPRVLHPAFYGAFDWHSAVHGHWTLAYLMSTEPDLAERAEIEALFDETLTVANLAAEAAYLAAHPRFERTYGWAWLLELSRALRGTRWAAAIAPLESVVIDHYLAFLPKQAHPIRTGVHPNTAFGLALALDHARAIGRADLEQLVVERALAYFADDADARAAWEPGGEDFFSPTLVEADLMRRIVPDFGAWLARFLPALPQSLATPVTPTDRSDGKLAHLDGLNLSRAWCMTAIAAALPDDHPLRAPLENAAAMHERVGLAAVGTGEYAGDHWLASFAVYLRAQRPSSR
jgi:hypothetical protein